MPMIWYALDENDEIITIDEAKRGVYYKCP
jgi:hypothetical protein